ncbi:VOC family protein [Mycolicibacterium brumae]|uniref:VOC family protein n=1 Tax=Mycolicibacterium brumae TaxID=85968 RepID=A0A2G5P4E1_9MYCO|nr:VOC family protein [Mycolicibacterium brumae]MCV7194854.1 VOC family protein [Mycolicibacterium brumae]PIB73261.1 VOC family protein [Mycolicibacterium brumae]RWA17887.1 hypothetical protein MBRU_18355 [Mycolicibacterium brumae DSM 44177]UWW09306.1 VOC family protein [Mycolicibacterium brumae]
MTQYQAPVGAPIWLDLVSSDPDSAAPFYRGMFGWELEGPRRPDLGGYQNFTLGGERIAGMVPAMADGPTDIWSVYLRTDDAEATARAVQAAGGSILVPPMAVVEFGSMLVATDPAGAVIGFWQPGTHPGFTEWGVHGTPYWFECHSQDYATSQSFYQQVTGARLEELDTSGGGGGPGRYCTLNFGDRGYAGIMDAAGLHPDGVPSFWQVYITVDDVSASVARAAELGGSVLMPGEDTPWGTLAVIRDPLGAVICLGHPPAAKSGG